MGDEKRAGPSLQWRRPACDGQVEHTSYQIMLTRWWTTSRNRGSCSSSTWSEFHSPESRTRSLAACLPSQSGEGGSIGGTRFALSEVDSEHL